jgi:hypothetical protein
MTARCRACVSFPVRLALALVFAAACVGLSARLARAACVLPPASEGVDLGMKSIAANTTSATTGPSLLPENNIDLGTYQAGTTIIVGFVGVNAGTPALLSGDTFIRLFDGATQVALGDDACGTLGARVVYTVPQGDRALTARLGCFGSGACAGRLYRWNRLDSNGNLTTIAAHNRIITGAGYNGATSSGTYGGTKVVTLANANEPNPAVHWDNASKIAPTGYIGSGWDASHFQGIARLRAFPSYFAISGSYHADLIFVRPCEPVTADKTWLQSGSTCNGIVTYRFSNYDIGPTERLMNHFGGIQGMGKYIVVGTHNYPDQSYGRMLLIDASKMGQSSATMRTWMIDPQSLGLGAVGPSNAAATKLRNGAILLATSRFDQQKFDFFRKDIDEASTYITSAGWNGWAGFADIASASDWILRNGTAGVVTNGNDNNAIGLVTLTNGDVYLLGIKYINPSHRSFAQQVLGADSSTVTLAAFPGWRTAYNCEGGNVGCNFHGAAGFYINPFNDSMSIHSTSMFMRSSDQSIDISEFGPNLAQDRPASQSPDTSFPGTAIRATDGNADGNWYSSYSVSHTNIASGANWQVDLGAWQTVSGVKVFPRTDWGTLENFTVETFNGLGWAVAATHTPTVTAPVSIPFTPTTTPLVRIRLNGTNYLCLAEVMVF